MASEKRKQNHKTMSSPLLLILGSACGIIIDHIK